MGEETESIVERNLGKIRTDKVINNKVDRIIVVAIEDHIKHPLVGKIIKKIVELKAHDEKNECGIDDTVKIMETKPLSKNKRWGLVEVVEKTR